MQPVLIYFISRTIENELYHRTSVIFDDTILAQKRVAIIGLGAIGSEVAKSLAKNGVGKFNLIDKDTFEIGNAVRHAADLFYVGENKTDVVRNLILRVNPNISVNTYKIDVLNDHGILEKVLSSSDLCLVLTGEDSVDYLINDKYGRNYDISFVYARVSNGAVSGSIQIVNKESACLRCLSSDNLDFLPDPAEPLRVEDLTQEYGSCSSPALPGSEIDTKEIALQTARITLQLLLGEAGAYAKLAGWQFYWHGPYGSKTGDKFNWQIERHPGKTDCKTCSNETKD